MAKICYTPIAIRPDGMAKVLKANEIIAEYQAQGFKLTLRQLYYQFVARDLIPNNMKSYKNLGSLINDGRLAGLIDWNAIEDRTRNLKSLSTWTQPQTIVRDSAYWYKRDLWSDQTNRPEVWIEKEALAGVIEGVCQGLRVSFFACRGYVSQSEMWDAGCNRLSGYIHAGQTPVILHFGDHDPSGIDMTRDIEDRLSLFAGGKVKVKRLALNFDQIETYKPPPNPAKITDSRFADYEAKYGSESWELDALEPKLLAELITDEVESLKDPAQWEAAKERESEERKTLYAICDRWDEVREVLA